MASRSQSPNPIRPLGEQPAPDPAESRPGIDQIRELAERGYELLLRQRRGFSAAAGLVGAPLALVILLMTPLYEATSLLLVKFGRELYQPDVGAEQTFTNRDKETVINSELAILHSRPVMQGVVRAVGIDRLYPELADDVEEASAAPGPTNPELDRLYAEAAERLNESLTAQALPDADVLSIKFLHEDPIVAETTVRELVSRFLEAHLDAYGEPEIVAFLDQRVDSYQARLDESEKKLLQFETTHTAFALENPQTTLIQWRDETRHELSGLDNQMAAIRLRHFQEDVTVAEARSTLMNLQMEAAQLQGGLLKDTRERIQVVQRFIRGRKTEIDGEIELLGDKREALLAKLENTEQELARLPTLSAQYRRLRRERDADEEQYSVYLRRLRDARLSNEMDLEKIASINIIQPASTSPNPVWPPSKGLSLMLALVLALVAGGLAAVLLDRVGPTGIPWLDGEPQREI